MHTEFKSGNLNGKVLLKDLGAGVVTLRWMIKERGGRM
jgi:hypothetical protein